MAPQPPRVPVRRPGGQPGVDAGNVLKLQAESASAKASAQSVINIFLPGGIAAQESFDPKLLAPIEYRGPLGTVKTKLDGVYFAEPLQKTAQVADRLCVVRSMTHGEADHARGHAQHVHRLAAQPGGAVSEHRQHRVA